MMHWHREHHSAASDASYRQTKSVFTMTDVMEPFIYARSREDVLDDTGVAIVLRELSGVAKRRKYVVCDLSEGDMTFAVLQTLPAKLAALCKVEELRILALDLSFNRIQCNSWEELEPVLDQQLGQRIVHLLELGNNSLPALENLKQSARLSEKFNSFGNRLSMLGYDSNPFTGDPDLDHWLSNARHFKHEVYGRTYID